MEFSRQEYWSVLLFPFPGDLPDPGIEPKPPASQEDSLPLSHQGSPDLGFRPLRRGSSLPYLFSGPECSLCARAATPAIVIPLGDDKAEVTVPGP